MTTEILRPSSLQQYAACPGSYRMQLGFPTETSPEAEEGSLLHERVRRNDTDGLDVAQAGAVEACREFLADTIRDTGLATVRTEQPLDIHDTDGNLLTRGTTDALLSGGTGCEACAIIDWKFGRVPVPDVSGNLQLAAYALGAMQLTGATRCVAHVFQPRIKAHTCHEFTRPDAIARNIRRVIDRATSGPLVLEAGEQCRYCKAKAVCPAFKAQTDALAVMRDSTKALTTPETLATYYAKAQIVKRFCTQVEDAMKAYLDEHGECAGYAYQEVAGRREVSDICGLCFAVSDIITRGEFLECCTASTAQVESLYVDKVCAAASAKGEKLTKKDAKERFEAGAAAFISRAKPTRIVVFKEVAQ